MHQRFLGLLTFGDLSLEHSHNVSLLLLAGALDIVSVSGEATCHEPILDAHICWYAGNDCIMFKVFLVQLQRFYTYSCPSGTNSPAR